MRIASAIPVQRPGPAPVRTADVRPLVFRAIHEISAAQTLAAPRRGDAAWLTLLATQTLGGTRRPDVLGARRGYGGGRDDEAPIFALVA